MKIPTPLHKTGLQHANDHCTLGIETSCDDTAAGIYSAKRGLIAHLSASQIDTHAPYGGVVPELASRDHIRQLEPLIKHLLAQAKHPFDALDAIAYTAGPGLAGALLVGSALARSLAFSLNIPAIGINHLEGHLLSPLLTDDSVRFPFLCLLISGGHTLLIRAERLGYYQVLGETLDDAVGEAYDKTAKLLNLGYPGGAALAKLAQSGNPETFTFPRPLINDDTFNFSFSGLKTYARNTIAQHPDQAADIACAFQQAANAVLVVKCQKALESTKLPRLVVAGGVSANQALRTQLARMTHQLSVRIHYPQLRFCTDNGAMIALAGSMRLRQLANPNKLNITIKPRWPITELETP